MPRPRLFGHTPKRSDATPASFASASCSSGLATRPLCTRECKLAVEQAGKLLESLGHTVEIAHPEAYDEPEWLDHWILVVNAHSALTADDIEAAAGQRIGEGDIEPYAWRFVEEGRKISATSYLASMNWLHAWARRLASWWVGGFDLLVTPTLGEPPPRLGDMGGPSADNLAKWERNLEVIPFTRRIMPRASRGCRCRSIGPRTACRLESILFPAYGQEDLLLRVGSQIEQAQPWMEKRPPVCA